MDDDDIPELEDFSEELSKIRKQKGETNQHQSSEIKVNVVNQQRSNANIQKPQNTAQQKPKDDLEDFGKGFKRGFFRKQNQQKQQTKQSNTNINTNTNNKPHVEDLTHIKSAPGTTSKTKTVENFNNDLKKEQESNKTSSLLNNIVDKKDQWLNQELLMKIAKNPNLMKCFMDPRFSIVIQEMQKNPQECMRKYGNIPEFSTFIREFSALMGEHFNKLATNLPGANPNMNLPEVQAILNDPKVAPVLMKLQREGKIDVEEINRDPELARKIKVLIDKKILNIQKMD